MSNDKILNVPGAFKVTDDGYKDETLDYNGNYTELFDESVHTTRFRVRDDDDTVLSGVTSTDQEHLDGLRTWAEAEVMVSDDHVLEVEVNGAWESLSEPAAA